MQRKGTEQLVEQAKQKDPNAFTELMQLYLKDMHSEVAAIL